MAPRKPKRFKSADGEGYSAADRVHKTVTEHTMVDRGVCADLKRRKHLEKDPAAWLKFYFSNAYYRPFEKPHLAIIDGAINASARGERFAIAGERGIGKSAILWGVILFLKFTDKQEFPACIPWAAPALKRAFRFWKAALCFNERLAADYPEYCNPFKHSKGVPQKCNATTWRDTIEPTGAQLAIGEGLIVFPDSRGCIGGATINGNPRGLNHPTNDGRILRPTIVLLDDVQDRQVANSEAQIADTIEIIDGDVGGMGEAGADMPMLMAGNCIVENDVMAHYLSSANWKSIRVPCVECWPDGWCDADGPTFKLWEEWYGRLQANDDQQKFYVEHETVLTKDFSLSCPSSFDEKNGLNAFQSVMCKFFKMGLEAFYAEKQQAPRKKGTTVYDLNAGIILSRTTDRKAGEVPEWSVVRIAATDINPSYALTWELRAFDKDATSAVLAYGTHAMSVPKSATEGEVSRAIYENLIAHGKKLAALPCKPEHWFVDAGGSAFDVVLKFCQNSITLCGLQATPCTGRGAKNYRQYGKTVLGKPKEQCHMAIDTQGRKWVAWNSDYWKEIAQKAWTGSVGAPGSCSLPSGNHREYAEQICREPLLGKGEVGGIMMWNFAKLPGKHDFGDTGAMCCMGCAFSGIGTGGATTTEKKKAFAYVSVPQKRR